MKKDERNSEPSSCTENLEPKHSGVQYEASPRPSLRKRPSSWDDSDHSTNNDSDTTCFSLQSLVAEATAHSEKTSQRGRSYASQFQNEFISPRKNKTNENFAMIEDWNSRGKIFDRRQSPARVRRRTKSKSLPLNEFERENSEDRSLFNISNEPSSSHLEFELKKEPPLNNLFSKFFPKKIGSHESDSEIPNRESSNLSTLSDQSKSNEIDIDGLYFLLGEDYSFNQDGIKFVTQKSKKLLDILEIEEIKRDFQQDFPNENLKKFLRLESPLLEGNLQLESLAVQEKEKKTKEKEWDRADFAYSLPKARSQKCREQNMSKMCQKNIFEINLPSDNNLRNLKGSVSERNMKTAKTLNFCEMSPAPKSTKTKAEGFQLSEFSSHNEFIKKESVKKINDDHSINIKYDEKFLNRRRRDTRRDTLKPTKPVTETILQKNSVFHTTFLGRNNSYIEGTNYPISSSKFKIHLQENDLKNSSRIEKMLKLNIIKSHDEKFVKHRFEKVIYSGSSVSSKSTNTSNKPSGNPSSKSSISRSSSILKAESVSRPQENLNQTKLQNTVNNLKITDNKNLNHADDECEVKTSKDSSRMKEKPPNFKNALNEHESKKELEKNDKNSLLACYKTKNESDSDSDSVKSSITHFSNFDVKPSSAEKKRPNNSSKSLDLKYKRNHARKNPNYRSNSRGSLKNCSVKSEISAVKTNRNNRFFNFKKQHISYANHSKSEINVYFKENTNSENFIGNVINYVEKITPAIVSDDALPAKITSHSSCTSVPLEYESFNYLLNKPKDRVNCIPDLFVSDNENDPINNNTSPGSIAQEKNHEFVDKELWINLLDAFYEKETENFCTGFQNQQYFPSNPTKNSVKSTETDGDFFFFWSKKTRKTKGKCKTKEEDHEKDLDGKTTLIPKMSFPLSVKPEAKEYGASIGEFGDINCIGIGGCKPTEIIKPIHHGDGDLLQKKNISSWSILNEIPKERNDITRERKMQKPDTECLDGGNSDANKNISTNQENGIDNGKFLENGVKKSSNRTILYYECSNENKFCKSGGNRPKNQKFNGQRVNRTHCSAKIKRDIECFYSQKNLTPAPTMDEVLSESENQLRFFQHEKNFQKNGKMKKKEGVTKKGNPLTNAKIPFGNTKKNAEKCWLQVPKNRYRNKKSGSIEERPKISNNFLRDLETCFLRNNTSYVALLKLSKKNCFQSFYKRLLNIFCVTSKSSAATPIR